MAKLTSTRSFKNSRIFAELPAIHEAYENESVKESNLDYVTVVT